ncbi:hypothetical protein Dip518_000607 [Parelusimicrobium proximum]
MRRIGLSCFFARPWIPPLASLAAPIEGGARLSRVIFSYEKTTRDNLLLCKRTQILCHFVPKNKICPSMDTPAVLRTSAPIEGGARLSRVIFSYEKTTRDNLLLCKRTQILCRFAQTAKFARPWIPPLASLAAPIEGGARLSRVIFSYEKTTRDNLA